MTRAIFLAATSVVAIVTTEASADAVRCGETYTVQRGDHLSDIAKRAYGRSENYSLIYNANADVIGTDPSMVSVGASLVIPCAGTNLTASKADNSAIRRTETTEALPGPAETRPIRVLTATDWAPFTDEAQENGGMLTEIVNLALAAADSSPEYQIDFVNDWGAHLSPLLTDHAYDFSIGWTQPNCAKIDELNDDSKFRCNNFNWTDPLYQQVVAYYSLSTTVDYSEHSDLIGMNICRPEGYSTAFLEEYGLAEPAITLVRPGDPQGCLDALIAGEADIALIATDVAEGLWPQLADPSAIKMHEPLAYVSSLRALIAKTHPRGAEFIETMNNGLTNIKDSGVWFETVRRHMTAHRALNS